MKFFGCLFLIFALAVYGYGEWWIGPTLVGRMLHAANPDLISSGGFLEAYTLMVLLSVVGFLVAKYQIRMIPAELAGAFIGTPGVGLGPRVVKLLGAVLLAIPGFFTGALGLVLLIPPMPWLLSRAGTRLGMAVARVALKRMMAGAAKGGGGKSPFGGAGGFAGLAGFPDFAGGAIGGGAGFPFPGMKPDDRVRPGKGKTYDVAPLDDEPKLK